MPTTVYRAGDEAELIKIHGKTGDVEILIFRLKTKKIPNYTSMEHYLISCPRDFDLNYTKPFAERIWRVLNYLEM